VESTLSLTYVDLQAKVGLFLGWGRGAAFGDQSWSDYQSAAIEDCVRSGCRQFYVPPAIPPMQGSYDWSFLRPTSQLDFPTGTQTLVLPDDFGGVEGTITCLSSVTQITWPVRLYNENYIRQQYIVDPTMTGRPMAAAVQPIKGTSAMAGQRFELQVFPVADEDYTLVITYYVNPDCLSGAFPYALGGSAHTETVLESCLAIAEQRFDDASTIHSAKFMERLQASISYDRRLKPQVLGYNRDRSDWNHGWSRQAQYLLEPNTTYNGQSY
jgi:hypothetical protein